MHAIITLTESHRLTKLVERCRPIVDLGGVKFQVEPDQRISGPLAKFDLEELGIPGHLGPKFLLR